MGKSIETRTVGGPDYVRNGQVINPLRSSGMSDDKSNRGPQDASKINVHEDYEVQYWTKELGVTEERLRQLVKDHGVSVGAVRSALGK